MERNKTEILAQSLDCKIHTVHLQRTPNTVDHNIVALHSLLPSEMLLWTKRNSFSLDAVHSGNNPKSLLKSKVYVNINLFLSLGENFEAEVLKCI